MFNKLKHEKYTLEKEIFSLKYELDLRRKQNEIEVKNNLANNYLESQKQKYDYEHTFHSEMEEKRVELSLLDAKIEERKALLKCDFVGSIVEAKDKEIERLQAQVIKLIEAIGHLNGIVIEKTIA